MDEIIAAVADLGCIGVDQLALRALHRALVPCLATTHRCVGVTEYCCTKDMPDHTMGCQEANSRSAFLLLKSNNAVKVRDNTLTIDG